MKKNLKWVILTFFVMGIVILFFLNNYSKSTKKETPKNETEELINYCLEYIKKAREYGSKYPYLWLYELIIFYKQKDINKCSCIIDSFKQEKVTDYFLSQVMHVFKQKISNKKTTSILFELYRKANKEKDYEKKIFISYLLINELITQSDYKRAFKYLSDITNFKE